MEEQRSKLLEKNEELRWLSYGLRTKLGFLENIIKDVEGTWKQNAFLYARSLMGSFVPKHEHKELVCAMIFEECLIL